MNIRRLKMFNKCKKKKKQEINHNITKKNNNKVWRDYVEQHIDDPRLDDLHYHAKLKVIAVWYKKSKEDI